MAAKTPSHVLAEHCLLAVEAVALAHRDRFWRLRRRTLKPQSFRTSYRAMPAAKRKPLVVTNRRDGNTRRDLCAPLGCSGGGPARALLALDGCSRLAVPLSSRQKSPVLQRE